MTPLSIGNVTLKNRFILAPMAGFSDAGFRHVCALCGAGLTVTEMVSAKGLVYGNKNTAPLLAVSDSESVRAVQLFGSDPEFIKRAAEDSMLSGFHIIDLNMGCPVPKIVKSGEGSALMRDLHTARQVITAAVRSSGRPVTVKFRSGWDASSINCAEFAKMCEDSGASAITIHPRTRDQFYGGRADKPLTERVKRAVNIPVIHSGDLSTASECAEMLKIADAVMIGRGALGRPQIFSALTGNDCPYSSYELFSINLMRNVEIFGEETAVKNMRKHAYYYIKGAPDNRKCKQRINSITAAAGLLDEMSEILPKTVIGNGLF